MTTEEKMEVMKAYIEGKPVQCKAVKYDFCIWMEDSNPCWDWNNFEYRVKPEAPEKSLRDERREMANAVSNAVWKELMARAKNIEGPVNTTMVGFGFNDISDIVLNKILEYKRENVQAIGSMKKTRRMTYKELDDWLEQGKGVFKIGNKVRDTISYDCEFRNQKVAGYYKICGYGEDTWHEPLIEV